MQTLAQVVRKYAYLLATGQVTSYGSGTGVDDGALQKGIAKPTAIYTILTTGQYSGTTNITINSKTDAHSNNCVYDTNTRLMWSRYASASVGPNSNGTLPWTTNANGEGIYTYVAAANVATLAGYGDWRVPNIVEALGIGNLEAGAAVLNATAFPTPPSSTWTSTTVQGTTANAYFCWVNSIAKTTALRVMLVRGG